MIPAYLFVRIISVKNYICVRTIFCEIFSLRFAFFEFSFFLFAFLFSFSFWRFWLFAFNGEHGNLVNFAVRCNKDVFSFFVDKMH